MAGGAERTGVRWAGQLYRFLASARGTVAGAAALGAATAVAVALTAMERAPAEGALGRLAEVFEAADPFRSWWFAVALVFAATAALAAVAESSHLLLHPAPPAVRLRASVPGAADEAVVRGLLARRRRRVRVADDGAIVAERGGRARLGPAVAGAGGLCLCAGIAVALHLGESGTAVVAEDGSTYGYARRTSRGRLRFDLGAELQAQRLAAETGQSPRWRVALAEGAAILAQADLAPGDSFEHEGTRYRLESVRPGERPGRFLLAVGGGPAQSVAPGERIRSDGIDVAVVEYDPNYRGRYGPAARVVWIRPAQRPETGWVLARYTDFDDRVRRSKPPLRLEGFERRRDLRIAVSRPAGRILLVAGAIGIALGILMLAGPAYTRIEARAVEGTWSFRAETVRGSERLAGELDELVAELRAWTARDRPA